MYTAADPHLPTGLAAGLPRAERMRRTLGALSAAALALIGLHDH